MIKVLTVVGYEGFFFLFAIRVTPALEYEHFFLRLEQTFVARVAHLRRERHSYEYNKGGSIPLSSSLCMQRKKRSRNEIIFFSPSYF